MLTIPPALPATLQELSPGAARLCLNILHFTERDLGVTLAGKRVLTGFSGGADSTALLLILYYLAPKLQLSLTAAHLDHGLRSTSREEAGACEALCARLGIPCITERIREGITAAGSQSGVEEKARALRYDFFNSAMASSQSQWLVLGHQNNDLAEDILMRLTRGTGWPGLGGMPGVDHERGLLRPLLLTPREALEAFLEELGIAWTHDPSNEDPRFFRNRVRSTMLPLFLKENPSFLRTAGNLWRLARLDGDYFTAALEKTEKDRPETANAFTTPDAVLQGMPKALRLRHYKSALDRLGPGQALVDGLLGLDRAWEQRKNSTEHAFPGGKKAVIRKDGIRWTRQTPS